MSYTVRLANLPTEYPSIAAVLAAENPGWRAIAEELAHDDASRDPALHHATLVALAAAADGPRMVVVSAGQVCNQSACASNVARARRRQGNGC